MEKSIELLRERLIDIQLKQQQFQREIVSLQEAIQALEKQANKLAVPAPLPQTALPQNTVLDEIPTIEFPSSAPFSPYANQVKTTRNWEKFIGENLSSKIGIAILILGVGIGANYAIDKNLISPLMRIILGYLTAFTCLFFSYRLRTKMNALSAVLMGGSMAMCYFLSYLAWSIYSFLPQTAAFLLMFAFTVFTVIGAIQYKQAIIAHIAFIAAYGIPFLLSSGSGNFAFLFSYMLLINAGIVYLIAKFNWTKLFVQAFILTWLIFLSWIMGKYQAINNQNTALIFGTLFFTEFYLLLIVHRFKHTEEKGKVPFILSFLNLLIYFSITLHVLQSLDTTKHFTGLFTAILAASQFALVRIIKSRDTYDKTFSDLVLSFFISLLTLAIPIQLDGNWVSIAWSIEALLLFYLSKQNKSVLLELAGMLLAVFAVFSLLDDWTDTQQNTLNFSYQLTPIFNYSFAFNILSIAALLASCRVQLKFPNFNLTAKDKSIGILQIALFPCVAFIAVAGTIHTEIAIYWNQIYQSAFIQEPSLSYLSPIETNAGNAIRFKYLWQLNALFLLISLLSFFVKRKDFGVYSIYFLQALHLILFSLFVFSGLSILTQLYADWQLRASPGNQLFIASTPYIRYICFCCVSIALYTFNSLSKVYQNNSKLLPLSELVIYLLSLLLLSNEIYHQTQSNELNWILSLFWGVYALFMIQRGIAKQKSHLRVAAMLLMAITLIKIFFLDLKGSSTISKTLVLMGLGVVLLIVSYVYTTFRKTENDND